MKNPAGFRMVQLLPRRPRPDLWIVLLLLGVVPLSGCSVQSAKKNYVLAEKLWADGKYAAAVSEFEKVTSKDPLGKLGMLAQYRAAMTQAYFLSQYGEALRKLKRFDEVSTDPAAKWEAQKQIGEILFSQLEQFDQVILHYRSMIHLKPNDADVPEFLFRIGRSYFFLRKFNEAIETYQDLAQRFPDSSWGERGAYEVGICYYTEGGKVLDSSKQPGKSESFQDSINSFQKFIQRYPKSPWSIQARFQIASSYEEMDQLDTAYRAYEVLKSEYPSPKVIQIKMIRIKERQTQRSR